MSNNKLQCFPIQPLITDNIGLIAYSDDCCVDVTEVDDNPTALSPDMRRIYPFVNL